MMRRLFAFPWKRPRALPITRLVSVHRLRMGVWSDGAAFMAADSAAHLCGFASESDLAPIVAQRVAAAREPIILERGGLVLRLYGVETCIALLEAAAHVAPASDRCARHNADILSTARLTDCVRNQSGYAAGALPDELWRLHARVTLIYNYVSRGRFSPVKELCDLMVHAARDGRVVAASAQDLFTIAGLWGDHWQDRDLDRTLKPRSLYLNAYPAHLIDRENPARPYSYPASALADFRTWLSGTSSTVPWLRQLAAQAWPVSMAELAIPSNSAIRGEA